MAVNSGWLRNREQRIEKDGYRVSHILTAAKQAKHWRDGELRSLE